VHDIIRHIAHFDLDAFFVSVEILNDPSLKGKAVIVGGSSDRGVVTTCSYEARKYGVHSAMPMKTAMRLCPHATLVQGTRGEYSKYSRWVTDIIASKSPQFEKASIDEFYVDLTGMDKYFNVTQYCFDLRQQIIEETGLPISCGLSTSKLVSKIATGEAKPNGFLEIMPGKETDFLWPLPIDKIPGVGKQSEITLKEMGIYTIGDIAKTPKNILEQKLGKWGPSLLRKAHGIDKSTVENEWEQKSMSHENTFHENKTDTEFLMNEIVRLTEKTAYGLRQDEKICGCVTVKIRYSDFETITRQEVIDYTSLDDKLIEKAKSIFSKSIQKNRPVRLVGVRFSQLLPFNMQMNLFDNQVEKLLLYKTVDEIKNRFGKSTVKKGSSVKKKDKE
jgi:DNA polymerase IV